MLFVEKNYPYPKLNHAHRILDRTPIESLGIDGTSKGKANASGNDKGLRTTYLSMLASMHQITDGQAESIARAYPTFQQLMSAFEAQATQKDKERMLVGLPVSQRLSLF